MHIAFSIAADELAAWEARLNDAGVAIEGRTNWPRGGESIYFRDPDGHLSNWRRRACGRDIKAILTAYDFPYTGTMAPRVTRLSGEARNTIVAATSSTFGHSA